jgi:hypothetical protein
MAATLSRHELKLRYRSILLQLCSSVVDLDFNEDPDTDLDPGSQTNADPDVNPGQALKSQKAGFLR